MTNTSTGTILYQEHAAISAVLDHADRAVGALEHGHHVDPGIFRDLLDFFTLFVGQCHHGKEEQLLFPTLHLFPEMAGLVTELEHEHAQGAALVEAYAAAVNTYVERGLEAAGPLIVALRAYVTFLHQHISRENEDLLPALQHLEPASIQIDLVPAFERFEDDVMGKGTHARLHHMIDTLGPRLAQDAPH